MRRPSGATSIDCRDLASRSRTPRKPAAGRCGESRTWRTARHCSSPLTKRWRCTWLISSSSRWRAPSSGRPRIEPCKKSCATLSEDALAHLEKLLAVYHFTTTGLTNYARKAEIINTLSLAIEDCRVTRLTYESQQSVAPSPRDVHPYKLVRYKGSLYLFALAPEHKQVRRYKVDRIEACEMRSTSFRRPADFKVSSDLTGWFGMYSRAGMPDTQGFVGVVWGFAT